MINNVACRIFKEQIKLINQLPEKERPLVLYLAINSGFNQFEIQNENAYISESESISESFSESELLYLNQLSDISKCVLDFLKKNIICKEFSSNYGGNRVGAGRKANKNNSNLLENKDKTVIDTVDKQIREDKIRKEKETYKESFDAFWNEYPKQRAGSKQKAYTSFCRVIKEKRATIEQLLESVKDYACSDEVKRGYAKGCAAWLNDDRFNVSYVDKFKVEW